jgi:hypothetical protein
MNLATDLIGEVPIIVANDGDAAGTHPLPITTKMPVQTVSREEVTS